MLPECSHHSVKDLDEDDTPTAPQTPHSSSKSPQLAPYPQPRARKLVPRKAESEDGKHFCHFRILSTYRYVTETKNTFTLYHSESDWDPDNSKSSSKSAQIDTQQPNIAQAPVRSGKAQAFQVYLQINLNACPMLWITIFASLGSPEPSPTTSGSQSNVASDKQRQKVRIVQVKPIYSAM